MHKTRRLFWIVSLCVAAFLLSSFLSDVFARAGGGVGHGIGGRGGAGRYGDVLGFVVWPMVVVFCGYSAIQRGYAAYRIKCKRKQVSATLARMAMVDSRWAESTLLAEARKRFMNIQSAWSYQDFETLRKYLHSVLFSLWERDLRSQMYRGERNIMSGLSIEAMSVVDVKNFPNGEYGEFTVSIDARADDQTLVNGTITQRNNCRFREFWTFEWEKSLGEWLLREVTQSEGWKQFINAAIV